MYSPAQYFLRQPAKTPFPAASARDGADLPHKNSRAGAEAPASAPSSTGKPQPAAVFYYCSIKTARFIRHFAKFPRNVCDAVKFYIHFIVFRYKSHGRPALRVVWISEIQKSEDFSVAFRPAKSYYYSCNHCRRAGRGMQISGFLDRLVLGAQTGFGARKNPCRCVGVYNHLTSVKA